MIRLADRAALGDPAQAGLDTVANRRTRARIACYGLTSPTKHRGDVPSVAADSGAARTNRVRCTSERAP